MGIVLAMKDSVIMTTCFCGLMFIQMMANTVLGVRVAAITKQFDWKKMLFGILQNIGFLIGTDLLSVTVAAVPVALTQFGISMDGLTEIISKYTPAAIVILIVYITYTKYVKQAVEKMKEIHNVEIDSDKESTRNIEDFV